MNESDTEGRKRETIAFGRPIEWDMEGKLGTVFFGPEKSHEFPPLPVGNAETLLQRGFVDPRHQHNDAPPAARLIEWASSVQQRYKYEQFEVGLTGYMVGPDREDSRVAFTGVSIRSPGVVPVKLKREISTEFTADLIVVDDYNIQIQWD